MRIELIVWELCEHCILQWSAWILRYVVIWWVLSCFICIWLSWLIKLTK